MDMTDKGREGYGKFEETAHELEQAAADKAGNAAGQARRAGARGVAAFAETIGSRPAAALLIALAAGFTLGWLTDRR